MSEVYPQARDRGVHVVNVVDEIVVYDLDNDQTKLLAPITAKIWRLCDGHRAVEEIAEELVVAQSVVEDTIEKLFAAELLDTSPQKSRLNSESVDLSRRSLLTQGAAATLLVAPAIVTMYAPAATAALSRTLPGQGSLCRNEASCGVPPGRNGLCCFGKRGPRPGRCCPPNPSNPVQPVRCSGSLSRPIPPGCVH